MRFAIKYGGIIAAGVAIWVLADHYLFHISRAGSKAAFVTPLFFNLLQLSVLFVGIRAKRLANRDSLKLGQGIGSGLAISLAYGVFACIFFLAFYLIAGSKLLENESGPFGSDQPETSMLVAAFAGLFLSAMVGGLIYSAVISFAFRTAPKQSIARAGRQSKRYSKRRR